MEVKPGQAGYAELDVSMEHTAQSVCSGTLPVFSTPWLVALMESAAVNALCDLEQGQTSVGARIDVRHSAATPLSMRVHANARVVNVEGRTIQFEIEAFDEKGLIGKAEHTRVLVDAARFMKKLEEKLS